MTYLCVKLDQLNKAHEITAIAPHTLQQVADGAIAVYRFSENRFCFEELVVGAELEHHWKRIEK